MNQNKKQPPKLSKHDLNLIKGALRRAFARSDVHKAAKANNRIEHSSPKNPRCEKWSWCSTCGVVTPDWRTDLDHIDPVQPVDKVLEDMTPYELLERIWLCDPSNLSVICETCHSSKSALENQQRREHRKRRKGQ